MRPPALLHHNRRVVRPRLTWTVSSAVFSGFPDLLLIADCPTLRLPLELCPTALCLLRSRFSAEISLRWQAAPFGRENGRTDVTAIPFGVNTRPFSPMCS